MTSMTEEEWAGVQETLVRGGLRDCIDALLATRVPVKIHPRNRRIMEQAWDDGDQTVRLVATSDPPWFVGMFDDFQVCEGLEHEGVLYVITHLSGGGLVSVIVGEGLVENDAGTVFSSVPLAKAYIQGRMAG